MDVQAGTGRIRLKWRKTPRPEGIEQNYGLRGRQAVLVGGQIVWVGANGLLDVVGNAHRVSECFIQNHLSLM